MQIKIYLENPSELRLPMDYGYRLSSAVYRLAASDGEYSAFLHDMGYGEDGRRYLIYLTKQGGRGRKSFAALFWRGTACASAVRS